MRIWIYPFIGSRALGSKVLELRNSTTGEVDFHLRDSYVGII
jgi:hypothetical protein